MTDIAVLVVAADDGVMPQTLEALDHAKAANVPIVVAVNKVDKEDADPNRVRTQMVEHGIVPVRMGRHVRVRRRVGQGQARTSTGLLETILLVADLEELKGDPTGRARGTVIEAHLDKGRGPVATVLVQKGALDGGRRALSGTAYAKIRAMQDENGPPVDERRTVEAVVILGLEHVPSAGDDFREVEDEREARHIAASARRSPVRPSWWWRGRRTLAGPAAPGRARRDHRAEPDREGRRAGLGAGARRLVAASCRRKRCA